MPTTYVGPPISRFERTCESLHMIRMTTSIKGLGANRIASDLGACLTENFTLLVETTNAPPSPAHKGNIDQSATLHNSKRFHLDEVSDGCP